MNGTVDLTKGSILKNLLRFSLPYLLSCFLQTFYGLADLFVIGRFYGAGSITGVSVGSQVMHMLTVVIMGLAMGTTVSISRAAGAGDEKQIRAAIGQTVRIFAVTAVILTAVLTAGTRLVVNILSTPPEAESEAFRYLLICFAGVPFVIAYNVLSAIFRGLGDTKTPLAIVACAGVINIGLDFALVGGAHMGAAGAAAATVASQAISVGLALGYLMRSSRKLALSREDLGKNRPASSAILRVGVPVAVQDGCIQVGFLIITVIANRRGVDAAAAVGIVEKLISFLFLVPSAMLSSVSAIAAQNLGAGQPERARKTLFAATAVTVAAGLFFVVLCHLWPEPILRIFANEEETVIRMGADYLRSYVFDCAVAGIHFCFSGYFCACEKSLLSFVHNFASIVLVRVPGAIWASARFPESLYPMGWAAPAGSAFSALFCVIVFLLWERKKRQTAGE